MIVDQKSMPPTIEVPISEYIGIAVVFGHCLIKHSCGSPSFALMSILNDESRMVRLTGMD